MPLPWVIVKHTKFPTPTGLCQQELRNPVGVGNPCAEIVPRVATLSQPWAMWQNPVGIQQELWILGKCKPDHEGCPEHYVNVGRNEGEIKGKIEALEELYRFSLLSKKQMEKMIEPLKAQLQNLQSSEKSALEGLIQIPCSSNSANEPSLTPWP